MDNMQKAIRTTIIKSAICVAIAALMLSAIMGIDRGRRIAKPIEITLGFCCKSKFSHTLSLF